MEKCSYYKDGVTRTEANRIIRLKTENGILSGYCSALELSLQRPCSIGVLLMHIRLEITRIP